MLSLADTDDSYVSVEGPDGSQLYDLNWIRGDGEDTVQSIIRTLKLDSVV